MPWSSRTLRTVWVVTPASSAICSTLAPSSTSRRHANSGLRRRPPWRISMPWRTNAALTARSLEPSSVAIERIEQPSVSYRRRSHAGLSRIGGRRRIGRGLVTPCLRIARRTVVRSTPTLRAIDLTEPPSPNASSNHSRDNRSSPSGCRSIPKRSSATKTSEVETPELLGDRVRGQRGVHVLGLEPVGIIQTLPPSQPILLLWQGNSSCVQPVPQGSRCHTDIGGDHRQWLAGVNAPNDLVDVQGHQRHGATLDIPKAPRRCYRMGELLDGLGVGSSVTQSIMTKGGDKWRSVIAITDGARYRRRQSPQIASRSAGGDTAKGITK